MIRAIVAALFPHPAPPTWVHGLGFVTLPGAVRERRHGHLTTPGRARDHA